MKVAFFLGAGLAYLVLSAEKAFMTLSPNILIALAVGILVSRAFGDRLALGWSAASFTVAVLAASIVVDTYNAPCHAEWCGTVMPRANSYDLNQEVRILDVQLQNVMKDPMYAPVSKNGPVKKYKDHPELASSLRSTFLSDFQISQLKRIENAREELRNTRAIESRPLWARIPGGFHLASSWFIPSAFGYVGCVALGAGIERLLKRRKAVPSV